MQERSAKDKLARESTIMRVLCICPNFVPVMDSEAVCSAKVVKGLIKRGIDTVVVAFDYSVYNKYIDNSVAWKTLTDITIRIPSANKNERESIRSIICGLRYRTADLYLSQWVHNVLKKVILMHQGNRFDVVYSRSLPMEAHVVGYWVSRRLGLPWIANIDDPWDWHLFPDAKKESFSRLQMHMSNFCLKKTLKTADMITYPSLRLWKYHECISGILHHAEVIPHIGYSSKTMPDPGKVTFVHAGKLGSNEVTMRSPAGFLRAFKNILNKFPDLKNKMKIIFVGPEDNIVHRMTIDLGLEDNVNFTGRVEYQESLKYICSANVCILVEGKMKEGIYLPSKIADYIVSNKPVIALSPKIGTVSDLSKYSGIYRADPDDELALEGILKEIILILKNNELRKLHPSAELVNMFKEKSVMDRLISCINYLVHRRGDLPGTVQ